MAFNNNNNNNSLNRMNYPLPLNFQPVILTQGAIQSNESQLLTPRSIHKLFLSNVNQHLPDRFDYQTYFNVHGLCGRRSVSPVFYNSNNVASQQTISLPTQFQNCYSNNNNNSSKQGSHQTFANNIYSSSINYNQNNSYHPQIHYGISNTYSLVEPSTPNALKIPTTPTRSKSLSPSLRTVVQPPRIRHKQNAVNASISLAASTTSVSVKNKYQEEAAPSLPKMTSNAPSTDQHKSAYSLFIQRQQANQVQIQKPIPVIPIKSQMPQPPQPSNRSNIFKASSTSLSKQINTTDSSLNSKQSSSIETNIKEPDEIKTKPIDKTDLEKKKKNTALIEEVKVPKTVKFVRKT